MRWRGIIVVSAVEDATVRTSGLQWLWGVGQSFALALEASVGELLAVESQGYEDVSGYGDAYSSGGRGGYAWEIDATREVIEVGEYMGRNEHG